MSGPSASSAAQLSDAQRDALRCVLDQIIPESGAMPGAGEIGLVAYFEQTIAKTPDLLGTLAAGLAAADEIARGRGAMNFAALAETERAAVLDEAARSQPSFLPSLIFHTFVGYYQHERVVRALGVETHPPYPKGFQVEAGDLSLLDPVRKRAKMYREV